MSQENVETITRLYDEFLARPERVSDPGLFEFFDPAVEIRQSASFLGTEGTFHGYEGLARSGREVFETFRDIHWVPIRIIDGGDHVVATVDTHAYGKHSGVEVNKRVAHVWTLRGGRIVAWHVYMDTTEALEAVGLSEQRRSRPLLKLRETARAMSQENLELQHRLTDAFNRRDLDAYLALTDVDIEAIPRVGTMEGGYRGHDGTRRWWTDLLGSFPDFRVEFYEVHDMGGNLTLAAGRARGHGAGSNTPIEQEFWQVVRWRRGRCFWWAHFDTRVDALEAVGLSEQDAHADSS